MKSHLKWMLIGGAVLILAGWVLYLLLFRSDKGTNPQGFVPADAVAVMSFHPGQLARKMELDSDHKLNVWSQLIDDLAYSQDPVDQIIRKFIHKPALVGADLHQKGFVWLAEVKNGAPYIAVSFGVDDAKKFASLLFPLQEGGFKMMKSGSFALRSSHNIILGWNKTTALLVVGLHDLGDKDLLSTFQKLIDLPEENRFFSDPERISDMLDNDRDMVCYADIRKMMELTPARMPMGFEEMGYLTNSMILKVHFADGEMVTEVTMQYTEKQQKQLAALKNTSSVKNLLSFHSATNLVAAAGISLNTKTFLEVDSSQNAPWLLKRIAGEILWRDLLACFKGNIVLSLNHPTISLGEEMNDFLMGEHSGTNPFQKLVPQFRVTADIHKECFYQMLPQLLEKQILVREQQGFVIPAAALPLAFLHKDYNKLYCMVVDDVMMLSNINSSVTPEGVRGIRKADAMELHHLSAGADAGMLDVMLNVAKMYAIAGLPDLNEGPIQLVDALDKVYVHSSGENLVLTITLKDRKVNPLRILVPFLLD